MTLIYAKEMLMYARYSRYSRIIDRRSRHLSPEPMGLIASSAGSARMSRSALAQAAKIWTTPMSRMAIRAIANRLGANQAPGDIVERAARKCRE